MIVYTYYEYLRAWGDQSELLRVWADSWKSNGWKTQVLSQGNCIHHPRWQTFKLARAPVLKSVNPAGYDFACWARWFAFANLGGGIMVDFDVINRSLRPNDLPAPSSPVILEQHRVPCAVTANAHFANEICDGIINHQIPPVEHYSDMHWFQQTPWPHVKICREYEQTGWKTAPLVHFSTRACHGTNTKVAAIRKAL